MRAFMVCRNFSVKGGMLARNGVVQSLPTSVCRSRHGGRERSQNYTTASYDLASDDSASVRTVVPKELHREVDKGDETAMRLLLDHKADVNVKDDEGMTALHWAAQNGQKAVVRPLLDHKADVNAKDNEGRMARYRADQYGNKAVARCKAVVRLLSSLS
jgi:hypothetical protein